MTDLRYTIRSLLSARWFTVAAVLTFAVGIGLNVAVFSIVDRVLFRPLPYGAPDRLVLMRVCDGKGECYGSFPSLLALEARERSATLNDVAVAAFPALVRISEAAEDPPLRLSGASPNLLRVLQVQPVVGRDFSDEDALLKRRVGLLTYQTWQRRFAGSPDILGRTLGSGSSALTIVGVLPAAFIPPTWTSVDVRSDGLLLETSGWAAIARSGGVAVPVARLAPDASLADARAEIDTFVSALAPQLRGRDGTMPLIRLDPIQGSLFSRFTENAWLIVAAAVVLLLLACANLATLLLARGRSREHTNAIHSAIGAGPGRLLLMATAESLLVCLAGAAVALVAVAASTSALLAVLPPLFARYASGITDPRVLLTALAAALAGALVGGVGPAFRTARVDVLVLLQRSSSATRVRRIRGGRALLAVEAALGVALVLSAVVVSRSFVVLSGEDLGYQPEGLYAVTYRPAASAPPPRDANARLAAYKQVIDTLATTPGVEIAAGADSPVAGAYAPMHPLTQDGSIPGARLQVSATYFDALMTPFSAGRNFTSSEVDARAPVAILTISAVHAFFPHRTPTSIIGTAVTLNGEPPRTIVGVIPDLRNQYAETSGPAMFLPLGAEPSNYPAAIIRVPSGTAPPLAQLQQRLSTALGFRVIPQTSSMAERLDAGLADARFRAVLFTVLSAAALLLAAVGLFAVASFETTSRRYEMGVRLTLGASRAQIRRTVVLDACRPVLVGIALGLVGAFWGEQYLKNFMYGVQPRDPMTYASVIGILLATAVIAAWLPATRASRLDPAEVLRSQ